MKIVLDVNLDNIDDIHHAIDLLNLAKARRHHAKSTPKLSNKSKYDVDGSPVPYPFS